MSRPLTALAAAGLVAFSYVVLTAAATGARVSAPCTLLAAKSGILASDLSMRLKHDAAGRDGTGIDRLVCRDLTNDGRKDMTASISARAIGTEAWVFFRATTSGWQLAFRRIGLVRAQVKVVTAAVVEMDPVFRAGDKRPCCPSGGQKHYRFQWQRGKMVKVRAWHTSGA
jgi:hypothetical protein